MSSDECNVTSDCISDNGIIKECYEVNDFRDEEFFCDCSNYYGWVGEDCDQPTSTVYWERAMFFLVSLWAIFNILTLFKSLFRYIKHNFSRNMKRKDINPVFYVNIFALLAVSFVLAWSCVRVRSVFDPSFFKIVKFNGEESVQRGNHELEYTFLYFATIFQVLASIQIVISWLDVFVNLSKIFPEEEEEEKISERNLQRSMWILTLLVITPSMILVILERRFELVLGSFIISIFVSVGYIIGYFRLLKKFKIYSVDASKKTNSLKLIRTVFKVNLICSNAVLFLSLIFISSALFFEEILEIGSFNYFQLIADVASWFGLILITYTSYYVYKVNCKLINSNRRIAWLPFMNWSVKQDKTIKEYFQSSSMLLKSDKSSRRNVLSMSSII